MTFRANATTANALLSVVEFAMSDCLKGADGRTLFTVLAKRTIISKMYELEMSIYAAAKIIKETGGHQGDWVGNLRRWKEQFDAGKLNLKNAVSVRSAQPVKATTENPFHALFDILIGQERRTFAEVESMFAQALDRKKFDLAQETKDSLDVILKSKGLTLDDLKQLL